MQELADQRFAAGQVAVRFDPHAALNLPAAVGDARFDLLIEGGIMLLHKRIVLRLRRAEHVARILFDHIELVRESAGALADGFADRPQPAGVDMRMADRGHSQRGGERGQPEHLLQRTARLRGVGRIVGVEIDRLVHRVQQLAAAVVVFGKGVEVEQQHLEVEAHLPQLAVEQADLHRLDLAGEVALRLFDQAVRLLVHEDAEQRVRGGLDVEVEPAAELEALRELADILGVVRVDHAVAGQREHRGAVVVEDQAFAGKVQLHRDFAPRPGFGQVGLQMEPGAVPRFAPIFTDFDRLVFEFQPLVERHRLRGAREFGPDRNRLDKQIRFTPSPESPAAVKVQLHLFLAHKTPVSDMLVDN